MAPGAVSGVLAQSEKGYLLPVSGMACSGSAAAIPAPSFGSRGGGLQPAACGVGGVNLGLPASNWEITVPNSTALTDRRQHQRRVRRTGIGWGSGWLGDCLVWCDQVEQTAAVFPTAEKAQGILA